MENMTFRTLLAHLQTLSDKQLDQAVAVFNGDTEEVVIVQHFGIVGEEQEDEVRPDDEVFEPGDPYLMFID